MQLLSPENVKSSKDKSEGETKERIRKLRNEESIAASDLSQMRTKVIQETEKIKNDFAMFEQEMTGKKDMLLREVVSLEQRKQEALKPIGELHIAAEKKIKDAERYEQEIDQKVLSLREQEQDFVEAKIDLQHKEDALIEANLELDEREKKLIAEEDRVKKSQDALTEKWTYYHATIHIVNDNLKQREKTVEHDAQTNREYKTTLDLLMGDLIEKRREIRDGYISLQKARDEILGRKE